MALTTAQTTHLFEIFGIPQNGAGDIFASVVTLFGPEYETYDLSGIVSKLNTRISVLSAAQEARITALLTRWDTLTSYNPIKLEQAGDVQGTIADYEQERANIRKALSDILGFSTPSGGFAAEAKRAVRNDVGIVR